VQHGLLQEIVRSAPPDMPNVFLINITDRERARLDQLLREQPGVIGEPGVYASAEATLISVDGQPPRLPPNANRWRRSRGERDVTGLTAQPAQLKVIEGEWWNPASTAAEDGAMLCVAEDEAAELGVGPGSVIEWTAVGRTIRSTVACIHTMEEVRFGAQLDFVFNPGALEGLPVTYFGGVRMDPEAVAGLQRAAHERFPTVTVINGAEVLAIVQDVVDQVAIVVRFISLFAILAGAIILASSVAGSRFRRIREAAILKTVGATRRRVITVFSVEFLIIGTVAGLMGTLIATGFSWLLLGRLMDAPLSVDWLPALSAIALTASVAVAAGWVASYRILGQKPLEVLRKE